MYRPAYNTKCRCHAPLIRGEHLFYLPPLWPCYCAVLYHTAPTLPCNQRKTTDRLCGRPLLRSVVAMYSSDLNNKYRSNALLIRGEHPFFQPPLWTCHFSRYARGFTLYIVGHPTIPHNENRNDERTHSFRLLCVYWTIWIILRGVPVRTLFRLQPRAEPNIHQRQLPSRTM